MKYIEVKNKQNEKHGCALYAVANALCLNNFVTKQRLKQSKKGIDFIKINQWLKQDKKDFWNEIFYRNIFTNSQKMPPEIGFEKPIENCFIPYLLDVKRTNDNSILHCVAILYKNDELINILDSNCSTSVIVTKNQLFSGKIFHRIQQISAFVKKDWSIINVEESAFDYVESCNNR